MLKTKFLSRLSIIVTIGFLVLSCSNDDTGVTTDDNFHFTTIHGTVFDSVSGSSIESTAVYLGDTSYSSIVFYSDSIGEYKVLLAGYGTEKIIAIKTGYITKELMVVVSENDTTSTNILLSPETPN